MSSRPIDLELSCATFTSLGEVPLDYNSDKETLEIKSYGHEIGTPWSNYFQGIGLIFWTSTIQIAMSHPSLTHSRWHSAPLATSPRRLRHLIFSCIVPLVLGANSRVVYHKMATWPHDEGMEPLGSQVLLPFSFVISA